MASSAFAGVGTKFLRQTASSWVTIAEVNSISGPERSRQVIDVSSLDSTGGYREYITGFRDGGNVTLEMNFTHDSFAQFDEDFSENTAVNYRIEFPDTDKTAISFAALTTDTPINVPMDDKVTVKITLKVTGPVTVDTHS